MASEYNVNNDSKKNTTEECFENGNIKGRKVR